MRGTVLEIHSPITLSTADLKAEIVGRLNEESVIGLDALIQLLPQYSWNQIFHAVDQLARDGSVVLRRHRYDYTLFSTAYPS